MKASVLSGALLAALLLTGGCSDDVLDRIGTNPDNPETATVRLLLPQVEVNDAFAVSGTDLAWYATIFVEHSTGVHAQFEQSDKRAPGYFNPNITANIWGNIYSAQLKDLQILIEQASTGREAGAWRYVGIGKILKAHTLGITTDLFGRIPNSEALQGPAILKPRFDTQQSVYQDMQRLLDEALLDLDKPSTQNPGAADLFFGGDAAKWKRVAYALKARYANRLSKRDPQASATQALAALAQGLQGPQDDLTFRSFSSSATAQNPWFQELNDRGHFAVSSTLFGLLTTLNDPRRLTLVGTVGGQRVPAPNGTAQNDQGGTRYSKASAQLLNAAAPLPLMTYAEQKFIEAEAHLRLGNRPAAYAAYQTAVQTALSQQFVSAADAAAYTAQPAVFMGAAALSQRDIIVQKYISFYLYQPIEAYNDYRRTGFPALNNPAGPAPRRFPYAQPSFDSNRENVPTVGPQDGVWWDDGTED